MAKENFTAARIDGYTCKPGADYTIHLDSKAPGLGFRVTKNGARSYVFECRINGDTRRMTIGDPQSWTLGAARAEAGRLKNEVDRGLDPRKLKAQAQAAHQAEVAADAARSVTVGEAWSVYLEQRKKYWQDRHYKDHLAKAQAGGRPALRGTRGRGVTMPGPLFQFMGLRLSELTPAIVEPWAEREACTRKTSAALAKRLLSVFLTWCAQHPKFAASVIGNPAKTRRTQQSFGAVNVKNDVLQRQQLAVWFAAVKQLPSPATAAYLQTLLLTGCRSGELLYLQWKDIDVTWRGLTIRDKVEGTRTIPLTPYVQHLLTSLPRLTEWVFPSAKAAVDGKTKPMSGRNAMHTQACTAAKIEGLTLHGLRRSFVTLSEWLDCPPGPVAQIMGHKPSATAEKHYIVRELDLLRIPHERIEKWILEQAGVKFSSTTSALEPGTAS